MMIEDSTFLLTLVIIFVVPQGVAVVRCMLNYYYQKKEMQKEIIENMIEKETEK